MKKKTNLIQGSFVKTEKKIKGALDLNKEVLDTLMDKNLAVTSNCCNYFPTIPIILLDVEDPYYSEVPINAFFIENNGVNYYLAFKISSDQIIYSEELS